MGAWGLLDLGGMRPDAATLQRPERSGNDRPKAAVSTRDSFADSNNQYAGQAEKRNSGGVDGLLRAHAALVHEIE